VDARSAFVVFHARRIRKLYEDQSSQFYGIGVSILQHRDGVYVQSIIPNTPADKAGLRYGDRFLEIGGKDAKGYTSAEVSKNVRGERGTPVNLKIGRAGVEKPLEFNIVRGGVPLPSIRNYFMLKDGVGYVGFTGGFQETSAGELDEAIAELKKQGMKNLVLDLRGNPGGLLPQAIEVVSRFVPRGQTVVSVKGRARSQELRAVGDKTQDLPLVVMINGGSASASEIVAGAVQDYGTRHRRRFGQLRQRACSESFSAAVRNRFDTDDRPLLHAVRTFAAKRLFERFDLRLLHEPRRRNAERHTTETGRKPRENVRRQSI
jgi:carboxyl-terminal processing protease